MHGYCKPFVRKALFEEIMQKTRLRKRFFKKPYAINKKFMYFSFMKKRQYFAKFNSFMMEAFII